MSEPARAINLDAALVYALHGHAVFPVRSNKKPITPHGLLDATTDPEQIRRWWSDNPTAGVAIRTGYESGLVVLDVDVKSGGDATLAAMLAEHGPFPETPTAHTGGGGQHFYFLHPGGEVPNSAGRWPGIDIRGDGGYVVAPFSTHLSGGRYQWLRSPGAQRPYAPLPSWLLDLIRKPPEPLAVVTRSGERVYLQGERHKALVSLAGTLNRRGMARTAILRALLAENEAHCSPPKAETEVIRIVEDVLARYAGERPAGAPSAPRAPRPQLVGTKLDFGSILDPEVGKPSYLVDRFLPKNGITLLAADWKSGKTMLSYRLALDVALGRPVFGALTCEQTRVCVLQIEMPGHEDLRRYRRLALGSGVTPERVLELTQAGQLDQFSQPGSLSTDAARSDLHSTVLGNYGLIIIDSAIAAFAPADIKDNSTVRHLFNELLVPLTAAGATILLLHHQRKAQGEEDTDHPLHQAKSAVLGAQAFGAAATMTYALERLPNSNADSTDNAFNVQLTSLGGWTPGLETLTLHFADDGPGTTVQLMTTKDQLKAGGVTFTQSASVALAKLVRERRTITLQEATTVLTERHGYVDRTVRRAMREAAEARWITIVSKRGRPTEMVPGLI